MKKERSSSSASGSSQSRTKPSSSSRSTSSSSKTSSSQLSQSQTQSSQAPAPVTPGEKPKERVAVSLRLIYPSPGVEYSFEELKAKSRKEKYLEEEVESWNGWEWREKWEEEVERTGRTEWVMEEGTGWPVLFGRDGGVWFLSSFSASSSKFEAETDRSRCCLTQNHFTTSSPDLLLLLPSRCPSPKHLLLLPPLPLPSTTSSPLLPTAPLGRRKTTFSFFRPPLVPPHSSLLDLPHLLPSLSNATAPTSTRTALLRQP